MSSNFGKLFAGGFEYVVILHDGDPNQVVFLVCPSGCRSNGEANEIRRRCKSPWRNHWERLWGQFSWAPWRGQTSREFRCPLWVDCNNLTGQCHNKWWFVRGSAPEWGPSFRWVQPYPLKQWRQHSWILLGHGCLLKLTHNPIQKNLFKDLHHGIPMYIHILDHFGWFEYVWVACLELVGPILAARCISCPWIGSCDLPSKKPSAGGGAKWCLASLPSWNGCLVGGWWWMVDFFCGKESTP